MSRRELATVLVRAGLLAPDARDATLGPLGTSEDDGAPLSLRVGLTPERMAEALADQLGIPYARPSLLSPIPALAEVIPQEVARRLRVLPVLLSGEGPSAALYLAMEDPTDGTALAECRHLAGRPVRPMVAAGHELRGSYHRWYGGPPPKPLIPPASLAPPAQKGPKRAISVLELDAADLEDSQDEIPVAVPAVPDDVPTDRQTLSDIPTDPGFHVDLHDATPPLPAATEAALVPPSVLVVQGTEKLAAACREAVRTHDAEVRETSLLHASRTAKETRPFAIVVPSHVYEFDPDAFYELSLAVGALLVAAEEGDAHLEPLLRTAVARASRVG